MTPAEFNLNSYLQKGENQLSVEVYRLTALILKIRICGVLAEYSEVYLCSTPKVYLLDFFVRAQLDDRYKDGLLYITAKVRNSSTENIKPVKIEAYLYDDKGIMIGNTPVAESETSSNIPSLMLGVADLHATIENPQKWTAETPNY